MEPVSAPTPYDRLIRFHAALSADSSDLAAAMRKLGLDEIFTDVELSDRHTAILEKMPAEFRNWRDDPKTPRLPWDDRLDAWAWCQGIQAHVTEQLVKLPGEQDTAYRAALAMLNTPMQRQVAEALHMAAFATAEISEIMGKAGLVVDPTGLECYFEHFFDTRQLAPTMLEDWVVRLEARAAQQTIYLADAVAKRAAIEAPRDAEAILAIFGLNKTDTRELLEKVLHEAAATLYAALVHRRNNPARPEKEVKNLLAIVKTLLRMKEHLPGAGAVASIPQPLMVPAFPDENGDLVSWDALNRRRKEGNAAGEPKVVVFDPKTMVDGRSSTPEAMAEK